MVKRSLLTLLILAVSALLGACSQKTGLANGAPQAVESYLKALVANDANRALNLACKDYEADARLEIDSFDAVKATLKDAACRQSGTDGKFTLVSCTGAIVANYNGEDQQIDLADRTFQVAQESGDWRVCGYH